MLGLLPPLVSGGVSRLDVADWISPNRIHPKSLCSDCRVKERCLPSGLSSNELERVDRQLVHARCTIGRGESLYRAGDRFGAVFAIQSGFFKRAAVLNEGHERITGLYLPGDMLGVEGISSGEHPCNAVALETGEVCIIPFVSLEELAHQMPAVQRGLHRVLSRQIARDHAFLMSLLSLSPEGRLAAFLLNLAQRFAEDGRPAGQLRIPLKRSEIARSLGLHEQSVTRRFSALQRERLIDVSGKVVRILNAEELQAKTLLGHLNPQNSALGDGPQRDQR